MPIESFKSREAVRLTGLIRGGDGAAANSIMRA